MTTTCAPDQPQCTEPHVGAPPYTTPPCMLLIEDHPCVAEPLRQSLSRRAHLVALALQQGYLTETATLDGVD